MKNIKRNTLKLSVSIVHVFTYVYAYIHIFYICVCVCVCVCMRVFVCVTLSHIRSKAQAVVHNVCATFVVDQNIHTISTGTHHQQQQNNLSTTLEYNYHCCNCIVFWIYNVLLDLTWCLCQSYCDNEIKLHIEFCPWQAKWRSIHCLAHRIWSNNGWWSRALVSTTPFSTAWTCLNWTF